MTEPVHKKRVYVPPLVVDISGYGARGQLEGFCITGTNPTIYTCASGQGPRQDPAYCAPDGTTAVFGGCTGPGNGAAEGCLTGSLFVER
jgi:hypothetical protein